MASCKVAPRTAVQLERSLIAGDPEKRKCVVVVVVVVVVVENSIGAWGFRSAPRLSRWNSLRPVYIVIDSQVLVFKSLRAVCFLKV